MYYYTIVLLSFLSFLLQDLPVKRKKIYLLVTSLILFVTILFISCFRYNVGTDYNSYKNIFIYETPIEPLFGFLIKSVKAIGAGYEVFVLVVFILAFGLKLYVFKKLSFHNGFFLSLMLYCSFYYISYDINAIRQGLALSFILLACYYAYQHQQLKFYLLVILSSLVHYTAIVFIPFYLVLNIRLSKFKAILLCMASALLSVGNVFNILVETITNLLSGSNIAYFIEGYAGAESSILLSFSTIRRLFFFFLVLFTYDKINADDRLKQIIFWGNLLSIMLYLICSDVAFFSTRLSSYYRVIECIWLSYFPFVFTIRGNKYIACVLYFLYSILQVASALAIENNDLLPIQTIF